MSLTYHQEVKDLYKHAQSIFLHELTEDEQVFIAQLAFDNLATLPDAKFRRLKDLVRRKGHLTPTTS